MGRNRVLFAVLSALLAIAATACSGGDNGAGSDTSGGGSDRTTGSHDTSEPGDENAIGGSLVVYSGRKKDLVEPILERFSEETGVKVEIREGDTAEMAAQIFEEGDNSPADVFFGQDAGALGALASAGRLLELDDETLGLVSPGVRSSEGLWVGVSARVRVLVYNPDRIGPDELPASIMELAEPKWAGKVGWAPTNGSFQAFVTAMRVLEGEEATEDWLKAMKENETIVFGGNNEILDAVVSGSSSDPVIGLVNHYYLEQRKVEEPDVRAANHFFTNGDVGGLVNVAGVGVVNTSDNAPAARALVRFLLDEEAQTYFVEQTREIPLVAGMASPEGVPDLESITVPEIDLNRLEDLQGTLELLTEVGIV